MWNGINKVITLLGKTFFESNKEYYTLQISELSYVSIELSVAKSVLHIFYFE